MKLVFGEDIPIPARPEAARKPPPTIHEAPFKPPRPPRSGYSCTIAKFPEYKENPEKAKTRVRKVEGDPEPAPPFKLTYKYRSRPTSSVVLNRRNLRSAFPSAFRR